MTNDNKNQEVWAYDDLKVNQGKVEGYAYTTQKDGYDLSVSITSYEYERNGETRTNHVPHVVLSDENGNIVSEPHAHDSENPYKAIENGKETAEYIWKTEEFQNHE